MRKINWNFFKCYNENYTDDFENLTRVIFKRLVLKDKNAILEKVSNHPGFEAEPYEVNSKKYAFQSKFFESLNNSSYSQLADSLEKGLSSKVDYIYIFSNKDIDLDYESCEKFKRIIDSFRNNNVEINKICNDEIIDLIQFNPDYSDLKSIYFNEHKISPEDINNNLMKQLDDLSPRYISGFNINVELQKYFDVCVNQSSIKTEILEFLKMTKDLIQNSYFDNDKIKKSVLSKIDKLSMITDYELHSALEWINQFDEDFKAIDIYQKSIKPDDSKSSEKIYYCNQIRNTIDDLDFSSKPYLLMSNRNVLMIEGNAGTGKSHLLGYEAEYLSSKGELVYLLLGQKMIYDMFPEDQFRKELGIQQSSVKEWILQLEDYCKNNSKKAFILFDAVNECKNNHRWISFINDLITYVLTTPHVYLIFTIRKTYSTKVLEEVVRKEIDNGKIVYAEHNGFKNVLDIAVPAYFEKYNILFDNPELFETEFENPLLLKTYCEGYSSEYRNNPGKIFSLYENYIKKEEAKFDLKNPESAQHKSQKILSIVGKIMYKNGCLHAHYNEICDMLRGTKIVEYFDYLCKEKIFITYYNEEISDEEVFLNYEKFGEFIIAKEVLRTNNSYEELVDWCRNSLFAINEYGHIKYGSIGIFASLSVLAREKYNREILCSVSNIENECSKNRHLDYILESIYEEYFSMYKHTSDRFIRKNEFDILIKGLRLNKRLISSVFKMLIDLAGRNNELNIDYLHSKLISYNQSQLDLLWTITINNLTDLPKVDYIINYINKDRNIGIDLKRKYANLLVWLFASTNRLLRDTASKALVRLMKNDFNLMYELLIKFDTCNDLYVIERLLCCIYGATMLSSNYDGAKHVATYLYDKVFKKEYIIPDILIRDHSNCIIGCINQKEDLKLDLSITKPPYKSLNTLSNYDINDLISFYDDDNRPSGISALLASITPDLRDDNKLFGIYGDFGRYVFQSRISDFKIDGLDPYYYALHYIKNELKYDDKLFGKYDMNCDTHDRHSHNIERIGKKYEWLAMYHILAIVSDNYEYGRFGVEKYHGTWNNYCREFDPSILITSTDKRIYDVSSLPNNKCIKWSDSKESGLELIDADVDNLQKYLFCDWITLYDSTSLYSSKDSDEPKQSYADVIYSYFVPTGFIDDLLLLLKKKQVFPDDDNSLYELYLGEYFDSWGYLDLSSDCSTAIEEEVGVEKKMEKIPSYNAEKNEITLEEKEVSYPIKKEICRIIPTYFRYSWESEYDYSKENVLGINIPAKVIVDYFNLIQKEPGMWYDDKNNLVCADFTLVKDTNSSGLKIRRNYIEQYLKDNKMTFVIDTYLERRFTKDAWYNKQKVKSRRVMYYIQDNTIIKNVYEKDEYGNI